jgi:hypothetical protein
MEIIFSLSASLPGRTLRQESDATTVNPAGPGRIAATRHLAIACLLLTVIVPGVFSATALGATTSPVPALELQPNPAPVRPARGEARFNPSLVYQDQTLSEDTTWRGDVQVEGAVTVAPQATLSIEPGTVIRFRRKTPQAPLLLVQGRIVAAGTKEAPIVFASSFAAPAPADWQGIMIIGSQKKNLLENCRIEGAQTGLDALFSSVTTKNLRVERSATGLRFQDTLVSAEAGGVFDCDLGLSLSDSEANLRNLSVEGNRQGVSAKQSSVYLFEADLTGNNAAFAGEGCRVKLQGGVVQSNGSGVRLSGCEGSITGVTLTKNMEYGVSLTASRMRVSANQIIGNGGNGLVVYDGSAVAWDNAIYDNAGYDLYNAGSEEFRAPGNWWGTGAAKIFDNGGRGKVLKDPLLKTSPSKP